MLKENKKMTRFEQRIEKRRQIYENIVKNYNVTWEIVNKDVWYYVKNNDGDLVTKIKHSVKEFETNK